MATTTNKLKRIEPYPISQSQRDLLRKMRVWFLKMNMRKFDVLLGWGQKDTLSYTGLSWSYYIGNYMDREGYGEVAKDVLNKLRLIYIEESKGK